MVIVLSVLSALLILSVFISLVRNDFWFFRVFEYPRLQKTVLVMVTLACWLFYWPLDLLVYKVLVGGLVACVCYLFYNIYPYTIIAKKEMTLVRGGDQKNEITIFAANVLQTNTGYANMLAQIKSCDPDIIFLLETNKAWADGVRELSTKYPYQLLEPLENTYGLLFFSRFKLKNGKVNYLVQNDIPSIETTLYLPSGQAVQIWGLHPEPPVPGENLYTTAKDKELMKVALKVRNCDKPCFVFGDLNDVAWSYSTELFRKTSRLLDPRRGRGFYSTFSAHHWFLRFPLDYIFCSRHFGLIGMKRMPKNDSDHFATFTQLAFKPELKEQQEAPKADREEMEKATELATQPVDK
ncbi:MAG: endonuclease/exonuclease/phosphatase family protein [Chitinophagaceae bacterium]